MSLRSEGMCPYCGRRGWFTCGAHHAGKPLGLHEHLCPTALDPLRRVYWCSYCGRVRAVRCA